MNTLLVFCHPCAESYGAHLRDVVTGRLENSHTVVVVDLYGGDELPTIARRADLHTFDALVFVYPTWWSSLPAPLLSWVEMHVDDLGSIRRIVAVTSHGSGRIVNLLEGGIGRKLVLGGLRSRAAPDAKASFVAIYNMDRSTDERRRRFAERAAARTAAALA